MKKPKQMLLQKLKQNVKPMQKRKKMQQLKLKPLLPKKPKKKRQLNVLKRRKLLLLQNVILKIKSVVHGVCQVALQDKKLLHA